MTEKLDTIYLTLKFKFANYVSSDTSELILLWNHTGGIKVKEILLKCGQNTLYSFQLLSYVILK
jgi:hypothetical protein